MSRRTVLGYKYAFLSICFLVLSIAAAMAIRTFLKTPVRTDSSRDPASVQSRSMFEHRGQLSVSELGLLGSEPLERGRKVSVNFDTIQPVSGQPPKTVLLNLFPDAIFTADIQSSSVYMVNEGLVVGQIQGDPESSVRLMISNGLIDGRIVTNGREFRILDGGNGLHIITETLARKR